MTKKRKYLKRVIKIGVAIALFIGVEQYCHKQTMGFRMRKIRSTLSHDARWEVPVSDEQLSEVKEILNQPFHLIGKGNQSFVFASQDDKYVIKLFKHHHMNPNHFLSKVHFPIFDGKRKTFIDRMKKRLEYSFNSYKIAYEQLPKETGLIYMHLNKTKGIFDRKLTLIDKIGVKRHLSLDNYEFLVQLKAMPSKQKLEQLIKNEDRQELAKCIDSYTTLIRTRSQKGIADQDPNFGNNYGYISSDIISYDIGSFVHNPMLKNRHFANQVYSWELAKFNRWIEKNYPELSTYIEDMGNSEP